MTLLHSAVHHTCPSCCVTLEFDGKHGSFSMPTYTLESIGVIRSPIKDVKDAPLFYTDGAPDAHVELWPAVREGLERMKVGDEIIVITWLHLGLRDVLRVHPRNDRSRPLTGVFCTRSEDRPNPLGLHRCKVLAIEGTRLHVGPMEAIDGTPVLDIKPVVAGAGDA